MITNNPMQLKALIKNKAKEKHISAFGAACLAELYARTLTGTDVTLAL